MKGGGRRMKYKILILIVSILFTSCTTPSTPIQPTDTPAPSEKTQTAIAHEIDTAVAKTVTALAPIEKPSDSPQPTTHQKSQTSIPTRAIPTKDVLTCRQTGAYVGNMVTCRIDHAYCSYRPDIDGKPTFCNDAPYPNHSFTLLVWGSDWSGYDGDCIIVEGFVSRYKGKPQIVAESRSQVSLCR